MEAKSGDAQTSGPCVAYITGNTPYGRGEEFILTEMSALRRAGVNLIVLPRSASTTILNQEAKTFEKSTIGIPMLNLAIASECMSYFLRRPVTFLRILASIFSGSRNIKILLKNLLVFPKGLYLSRLVSRCGVSHIHAHWASTPSTIAYIMSRATGIPWSFTSHRWDIEEDNLLTEKVRRASFARVISGRGKEEICRIINDRSLHEKIIVIHMGVRITGEGKERTTDDDYSFLCPANLIPVKGHRYLLEACSMLAGKEIKFRCLIAGAGPLEKELRGYAEKLALSRHIRFLGQLNHESLMELYEERVIDAVVLPSIITEEGEQEGIPVSLMEAMSHGIPAVSTRTGGIPELLGDGGGIMIEQRNSGELAAVLEGLIRDAGLRNALGARGRQKIQREFNADDISERLASLFHGAEAYPKRRAGEACHGAGRHAQTC